MGSFLICFPLLTVTATAAVVLDASTAAAVTGKLETTVASFFSPLR